MQNETLSKPLQAETYSWRRALAWGFAFEIALVSSLAFLPSNSWPVVQAFNFLRNSHRPLLTAVNAATGESLLGLLVVGFAMAGIWAWLLFFGRTLLTAAFIRLRLSGRQKRWLGWSAALLCLTALAVAVLDASAGKATPFRPTPEVKAIVEGNTAFALDLYREVKGVRGNVFFSPYSVSTCLALAYAGARGPTERELATVGHFTLQQNELHPAFGELLDRMNRLQRGSKLSLIAASALWYQQGHPFSTAFLNLAQTDYHAGVVDADFIHAPKPAASEINAWLKNRTHGRINAMLRPDSFDEYTKMVLCSAVYFKGNWRSEFKIGYTHEGPFSISADQTVSVPMMAQSTEFRLTRVESPAAALLELPYYGGDLAMVIILPEAVDGLGELENSLTPENLGTWLAQLDAANPRKVNVRIPRFTAQQRLDLEPILRSLGAPSALDVTADFGGIDGTTNLFISQALHYAFIEVNEQGT